PQGKRLRRPTDPYRQLEKEYPTMPLRIPEIRSEQFEILDSVRVLTDLRDVTERNLGVRSLSDEAQRRGGRLDSRPDNVFGYRHSFTAVRPIRPGPGEQGREVDAVEFELQAQQYPSD